MRDEQMSGYVAVAGARLFYQVEGPDEAPVVVFSNSLGTDLRMWDAQARAFAGRFRVVRYDSRGHGRSDAPPGPYTLDLLAHDALALFEALGIARAHVCGLSLGGMVALWLAANHPERVGRAVFADTAAKIGNEARWVQRIAAVRAGGMRAIRDVVVSGFLSEPFRARRPDLAQAIGDMLEATPPEGYIAACEALRQADLHAELGRIAAPALVVVGSRDESTPPAQAHELCDTIAGSQLAILDGAAHLANVEQPDAFNAHALAFFSET